MKTAASIAAIACMAFAPSALAQADAGASPALPDYIAVMQALDMQGGQIDPTVTITHHAGMFLTETLRDGRTSVGFGPDADNPVLRWSRQADGEITALEFLRRQPGPDAAKAETARPLAQQSSVAGQDCTWRERVHGPLPAGSFISREQACVTEDGIVVETKLLTAKDVPIYHTRLVRLERRAISAAEIDPPAAILTPEFWLRPLREPSDGPDPSRPDYEITLESVDGSTVLLLRHYPWHYREERDRDGLSRAVIWNELDDQRISYRRAAGYLQLAASRSSAPAPRHQGFDRTDGKDRPGKAETVLGETCHWFDPAPDVADPGIRRCLTEDGLVLAEQTGGMASTVPSVAISLRRRPVDLSEMRLPSDAFSAPEWGLPAMR